MPALHNALIVSSHPRWLAASGLADILPWFSLAGHELSRLAAAPADCSGYAVAIIRLAPGETALDSWQWCQARMPGAILFTCGAMPAEPPIPVSRHLPDPIPERTSAEQQYELHS